MTTFGENYGDGKIGEGLTAKAGLEQPLLQWTPSIAPLGMAFFKQQALRPSLAQQFIFSSLKFTYLSRIELIALYSGSVQRESRLISELGERIRDVRQSYDGLLYVLTDSTNGKLIHLLSVT